jgi:hypothetical protein
MAEDLAAAVILPPEIAKAEKRLLSFRTNKRYSSYPDRVFVDGYIGSEFVWGSSLDKEPAEVLAGLPADIALVLRSLREALVLLHDAREDSAAYQSGYQVGYDQGQRDSMGP